MKLKEIYELAVKLGIEADPRGKDEVNKFLNRNKKKFEKLDSEEKEFFDQESLRNPYADTRILYGDESTEVKQALVGVDVGVGEVLLADRLKEKGEKIDLVISHHPEGAALAALSEVMGMQADIWFKQGVPINVGDSLINERAQEIFRLLMPVNHTQPIDAARILGIPFMCIHTPADNSVVSFLQKMFDNNPPDTVKDVVDMLRKIPEYKEAAKNKTGPSVLVGSNDSRAGKVLVDMTGGTGGPKEAIEKLAAVGVGTLVGMHMDEKVRKEAEKFKVNVIIAGHMSSDSIGLNLIFDKLEEKGVSIIPCSGFNRVKRM
ncbi:MAG: NGG1p interacting factor NIF3 [Actinobacteria bacterium]|nr:NGG1p interacting factor NIF3 [Actinomycetota bacterium]